MKTNGVRITGGCLCQKVRYAADHAPTATGYCHCRMCQRALGNTFGTWAAVRLDGFEQTGEEPSWHRSSDGFSVPECCFQAARSP